jgi:hypothetical protein
MLAPAGFRSFRRLAIWIVISNAKPLRLKKVIHSPLGK